MQSGRCTGDWPRASRDSVAWRRAVVRAAAGLFALVMCGFSDWAVQIRADSGEALTANSAGLSFTIDTRWLEGGGYRPVRVTITPTGPVIADHTVTVEFTIATRARRNEGSRRVVQDVEIPAGTSTPIEAVVAIPEVGGQCTSLVRVLEDGEEIASRNLSFSTGKELASGSLPGLLIVSDSAPGTSGLAEALSVGAETARVAMPYQVATKPAKPSQPKAPPSLPTAIVRSAVELPRRWIEYTNCDLICLSLDELHNVRRQNPEAFQAMLAWTSAGGNLLVCGVQEDWSRLTDLESLLNLPAKPGASAKRPAENSPPSPPAPLPRAGEGSSEIPSKAAPRGWTEPNRADFSRPPAGMSGRPNPATEEKWRKIRDGQAVSSRSSPFLKREYDLGMVVAIASDSPLPGDELFWNWLLNSLGSHRWQWTQRHGLSPVQPNPEFWKFQIPGVGLPPINAFRVLITLFVLAIGPLNYWLLRRRRQLQLLVITIPLGAAAVTLALFGYALVADGLGTRVRVRSVTWLDQRRGRAACWARMSYYSGLTPSGGLAFPADVAVIPFEFTPVETSLRRRELIWEDDQRLVSGWLPARTPTQLLTLRSRASDARLDVARPGGDAEGLEVANRLGARIEHLVVCGEDGKHYAADGLDAGAVVRLVEVAPADARAELNKAHQANKPEYPLGLDPTRLRYSSYRRNYRRYMYSGYSNTTTTTQDSGRLEKALDALDPARSSGRPLSARSYMAIVEKSPEVVLGTRRAREEDSFHVILGTW